MAAVARSGKTSSEVKKDRLEADRINMSEDTDGRQEKEKNRFGFIFKLVIIGDTVRIKLTIGYYTLTK